MMRRSTDSGQTWEEPRVIARVKGKIQQNEVAFYPETSPSRAR